MRRSGAARECTQSRAPVCTRGSLGADAVGQERSPAAWSVDGRHAAERSHVSVAHAQARTSLTSSSSVQRDGHAGRQPPPHERIPNGRLGPSPGGGSSSVARSVGAGKRRRSSAPRSPAAAPLDAARDSCLHLPASCPANNPRSALEPDSTRPVGSSPATEPESFRSSRSSHGPRRSRPATRQTPGSAAPPRASPTHSSAASARWRSSGTCLAIEPELGAMTFAKERL